MRYVRRILAVCRDLASSWFGLTLNEQKAMLLILALALLGVLVRAWHARHGPIMP